MLLLPSALLVVLLTATAQAATITVTASASIPTPSDYTSDSDFKADALASHNFYRAQHNASALTYNDTLAGTGSDWTKGCKWAHSGGPDGENLAAGYNSTNASITAWVMEREQYNFAKQGFSEQTGHFTQVVWKSTTSVGCGRKLCNTKTVPGWYVVCEYWPPGNVGGQYDSNVQQIISGGGNQGGGLNIQGGKSNAAPLEMNWSHWLLPAGAILLHMR
ncbi:MAG: hypothetical protein M1824_000547 [Vezdaea acicularis]|nr:MAG: hypothetical protein M1824_000547 [Vezdaea acicularis]